MHQPNFSRPDNGPRSTTLAILTLFLSISFQQHDVFLFASASAVVASPMMAFRKGTSAVITNTAATATATLAPPSATIIADAATPNTDTAVVEKATSTSSPTPSNPIFQLVNYVKTSCVNFKDGLVQMNTDHKRCKTIRAKQSTYALANGTYRPRGIRGIQTGGISYEEYDFLKKGLVDRNKLFAVGVVSVCLPNYFVYYMWTFPEMMPTPFLKGKDMKEISRERCHAVISTMLDIEKGARVAPWTSKLNPFGRKATERAMERLGNCISLGCDSLDEYGAVGPNGGRMILKKLRLQAYTSDPPTKQQRLLAGNRIPKQIMKGLTKAIGADPLNKGSSPFGISALKHIESVTLADEFLVNQKIDIESINSALISEACSARLIGSLGWTDEARKEALASWLQEMEISPREATSDGKVHYNGNFARAALMCYNVVDGTRDSGADSSLLRVMYQGQKGGSLILN